MYNSGSHSLLAQVGSKHLRRLVGLAVLCALSNGIWKWDERRQMAVAAPQDRQPIVLPKRGDVKLSRIFEPRSFAEMMAANSTAAFTLTVGCVNLTVTDLGDTPDLTPGDGVCADINEICTLRAAIQEANALASGTIINFSVNSVIQLGSALPDLTANMTIDGPGANLLTVRRNMGGNYRIFTNSAVVTING